MGFEQKYENNQNFSSENFHFLVVKISVYLNRHVFVMYLLFNSQTDCANWTRVLSKVKNIQ